MSEHKSQWRERLRILNLSDWDRRVRIGAGNHGGARMGSVAEMPALGIKLALRKAMMAHAETALELEQSQKRLERLQTKRFVSGSLWFVLGIFATVLAAWSTDFLFDA